MFQKNFNSHDVINIHNASLIFKNMQIKSRLLIHIQTITQISSTHPVTPEVTFDPELLIMPWPLTATGSTHNQNKPS